MSSPVYDDHIHGEEGIEYSDDELFGYDDDFCLECCEEQCVCYERDLPCPSCGSPGCPGYCDDYQTYNLRPDETGA
jgi:hypothetical protein